MVKTPNIKPIKNQVLIKLFPGDGMSTGGIFVPGSFEAASNKATVIAAGEGTKQHPMRFKAGDIIYRVKDHGDPVEINGELYYLMDQRTILAYGTTETRVDHN